MLFSSPIFLFLFLPVVLTLYFVLPRPLRNLLLLAASLLFYAWGEGFYIAVLLVSITLNYGFGVLIESVPHPLYARLGLGAAVLANLGILGAFKYAPFLLKNLNQVLRVLQVPLVHLHDTHLPLGISFFTFHALSYVIDVYRREARALRNPIQFALYISFFPQAIAGPIVRYTDVAAQLARRLISREGLAQGVRRFIVGLAKKMLVANTLAVPADAVFGLPSSSLTASLAWLGVASYTLQIYFDFSGYSDMAIGLAQMFGFRFKENFRYPYTAGSITDFWRRWHISLSTWFRDYLYIPLGGNRCKPARTYGNLFAVFFLCGLWHGASWTFVLWGLYHGAFLVLERRGLGKRLEAAPAPLRHLYVLLVVMVGWLLFRATTLTQATAFLAAMVGLGRGTGVDYYPALYLDVEVILTLLAGVVGSMPIWPWLLTGQGESARPGGAAWAWAGLPFLAVAALGILFVASAMLLAAGTYNPFLYFRF
jgi:alginate O-acetyltransferase complex protein AlgI